MQVDSSFTDDANVESTDKDSVTAEKKKLLREIQELKSIIEQCECELDTLRFADVETHVSESQNWEIPSHSREIPDVEVELQNELYNLAGLYCVKYQKNEIVFNFRSTNDRQKKDIYAIQILIENKKGHLGKWTMPISINVNEMMFKITINTLENLIPFVKNCKHIIDCYVIRQEQFLSLKKHTSDMKHCVLQSDMGYTHISLEIYDVYDKKNDTYVNLIIYLLYHSNRARPYKINIDTMEENKLSNDLKQLLKIYSNEFKISDLQTAFDSLIEDSAFIRMQMNDESPLELNNTSSCESSLEDLQLVRPKSSRKSKGRHKLQKKWNEKKKQKNTLTNIKSSESNEENSLIQTEMTHTKSSQQISIRKKEAEAVPSTSKQETVENLPEETPLYKPQHRLKQTKLNFQTKKTTNSANSTSESFLFLSKLSNKPDKKKPRMVPLGTSTPLYHDIRKSRKISSSSSEETDKITEIGTSKQTANSPNDSENNHQTNKKIIKRKTPKLLKDTTKSSGLLRSRTVKTNQRRKSMKNKKMRK